MLRWISRMGLLALVGALSAGLVACTTTGGSSSSKYSGPTSTEATGTQRALNESEVRVEIKGVGNKEVILTEARTKAAKAVLSSAVKAEAYSHPDWAGIVNLHTKVQTRPEEGYRGQMRGDGAWDIAVWVVVNSKALLNWAEEKGLKSGGMEDANLPPPQIMLVPRDSAGKLIDPSQLSQNQKLVEAGITGFISDDSRGVQIKDYSAYYNLVKGIEMDTGMAAYSSNLVDADIYITYELILENGVVQGVPSVKATIIVLGFIVTTGDAAVSPAPINTPWLAEGQVGAAIQKAARDAGQAVYTKLYERYAQEFRNGIPYIVMVSNLQQEFAAPLETALTKMNPRNIAPNEMGGSGGDAAAVRYAVSVRPEYGTPTQFVAGLNAALDGFEVQRKDPRSRRFIHVEMSRKSE